MIDGSVRSYTIEYVDLASEVICTTVILQASSCRNDICNQIFRGFTSPCNKDRDMNITVFGTNALGDGVHSTPTYIKG